MYAIYNVKFITETRATFESKMGISHDETKGKQVIIGCVHFRCKNLAIFTKINFPISIVLKKTYFEPNSLVFPNDFKTVVKVYKGFIRSIISISLHSVLKQTVFTSTNKKLKNQFKMKFSLSIVALFAFVVLVYSSPLPQEEAAAGAATAAAAPNRPLINLFNMATSGINTAYSATMDTAYNTAKATVEAVSNLVGSGAQTVSTGINSGAETFNGLINRPFASAANA